MRTHRTRLLLAGFLGLLATAAVAAGQVPGSGHEEPWLGVAIAAGQRGVLILEIIPDTPADEAGMQVGDEIVKLGGGPVYTPADLKRVIGAQQVGDDIVTQVSRDGQVVVLRAQLEPRLDADEILHRRLVGQRAPDLDLEIVYGADPGQSRALSHQVVILQFFTSDCYVCSQQHKALSRFADRHRKDDLAIIAVTDRLHQDLAAWSQRTAPSFSVARDALGRTAHSYRIEGQVPALVVIDRDGVVIHAGIGGADNLELATTAAERALRRGTSW